MIANVTYIIHANNCPESIAYQAKAVVRQYGECRLQGDGPTVWRNLIATVDLLTDSGLAAHAFKTAAGPADRSELRAWNPTKPPPGPRGIRIHANGRIYTPTQEWPPKEAARGAATPAKRL